MTSLTDFAASLSAVLPFGLDLLLRATLVLGIAQILLVVMKRRSAASRHFVATLGLAAVVALPLLMLALPDARLEVLPASAEFVEAHSAAAPDDARGSWKTGAETSTTESAGFAEVAKAISATGIADRRALTAATAILWVGDNWAILLLSVLTVIPFVFLSRILIGMLAVWVVARRAEPADESWMVAELASASRRLSVRRPVRMLLSDRINVPLVWGVLDPVLILPVSARNWTRDRFRVVILHEVAHVRRFDVLALMTGRAATALYWFHPLSWSLERSGRRECERACDDLVLRSGTRASDYADHLLGIAAGEDLAESYASVTLAMARPSELEGRLLSILRAGEEREPVSRGTATFAATLAALMLLPIATVRLTAKPVDDVAANRAAPAPAARSSSDEPVAIAISIDEAAPVIRAQLRNTDSRYAMQRDTKVELVNKRSKEYESEGEKWYADAYELHRSDRYDDAIAAFMKAIEHGYRVGTSMYNIGCGYAMKGDAENAVRWIDDAFDNGFTKITTVEKDSDLDPIRSDPRFRGLLRDLRARYGTSGRTDRFDAALDRFAGLRASGSQDAGEWADAGLDLLRLRQLDDAIVALEEAVRLAPDRSIAHYNLACAFALEGDHAHALDALERSILAGFDYGNKMSNDPDLESIRGEGRFAALRATNDDLSLWAGMKKRDGQNGRKWDQDTAFREDLPRFEAAAAKYPDAGRAWFNLGYATLRAGSIDRARVAFNRSLDLGFKRATSMYNLACVEAIAGNRDAAFDWLDKSEKAGGRFDEMHHDEDLDNIRDDPRFEELLDRMSERNHLDKLRKIEEKAKQKLKDAGWL